MASSTTRGQVVIGGMALESSSFSPYLASLDSFRNGIYFVEGQEILQRFGPKTSEIRGFLDGLGDTGWQIVPTVASQAVSAGPMTQDAYDWFLGRWLDAVQNTTDLAAVLLALHGATITERSEDACGDILETLRETVGPEVFIGASLDLHANITGKMVRAADALYGFHTYPHVDEYETGLCVGRIARGCLAGEMRTSMAFSRIPMYVTPGNQSTREGPNVAVLEAARRLESQPGVLAASFFEPQSWLDLSEIGATTVVITDGKADASRLARDLAGRLWALRHEFVQDLPTPEQAVREAIRTPGRPVVLSDLGDGAGGGAAGDSTVLLREFLRTTQDVDGDKLLTITDPEAVAVARSAGLGARLDLSVGGKLSREHFDPVHVSGTVTYLGAPSYRPYHQDTPMGQCAVISVGSIRILLTDKPIFVYAPDVYTAVGLEPLQAKIVVVKSGAQFRQHWEGKASRILLVNTPGPTSSDLFSLPFRRLPRPMFPWDEPDWEP